MARTLSSHEVDVLVSLLERGRAGEAEGNARALLKSHPEAGIVWKVLGVSLLRQGKDAIAALHKTTELMPTDAEAHANLGTALHDQGQWSAALASLGRAIAIRPDDADALVLAGNASRELGRPRDALALYRRAAQLAPASVVAINNLGNAYLQLTEYDNAALCYRRALELRPDNALILCNLGNALRQRGLLIEALEVTRRALERDPNLAVAHNNLGLISSAQQDLDAAIGCFRRAVALKPDDMDALTNLGNALRQTGRRDEALSVYARAVGADARSAQAHCNLASALLEARRLAEAIAGFRRALTVQPDHLLALVGLGGALRLEGRTAEAQGCCAAALKIDPKLADALSLGGELEADAGRFVEAEKFFQQAIASNPDFAFGYAGIASHRKMSGADAKWRQGAEMLLTKRLPLGDEVNLRFALGKYFDDLGEFDRAFEHYRQANDLTKRYASNPSRETLTQRIDGLMQRCDANFVQQQRPYASASELPVFIVGLPRSGTSLTEQILASHPAVVGAGEVSYWDSAFAAYIDLSLAGKPDLELMPGLAARYLQRLGLVASGAARVVDKMPANFLYLGLIRAALPRARIIHMQRHPIDTCLSIYFQNFPGMGAYANDLDNLAFYYAEYSRLMAHWRSVLPAAAFLEVPYEGLVEDQEGWTRRLLDFIGQPWDARCLNFHETERTVVTASRWQVRQKMHRASTARWKNYAPFLGPLRRLAASTDRTLGHLHGG